MAEDLCRLCPRNCSVSRVSGDTGVCGMGLSAVVARAAPHFGEEPCLRGERGSGTVFFSGCGLRCVFCQNREISIGRRGLAVGVEKLREVFLSLRDAGCHNINLVTPTHFAPAVAQALEGLSLGIPVVWNSSGYENVETLRRMEGLVQIYLPDMKFGLPEPATRYAGAPDYPARAAEAAREMYRQVGPFALDENGLLRSGLLIRHLILPGQVENTRHVIDWVSENFAPGTVLFSLMSQYTPCGDLRDFPEINRPISEEEYDACLRYLRRSRISNGFVQDRASSGKEAIPPFDLTGIL